MKLTHNYLWLPAKRPVAKTLLEILIDGTKSYEFRLDTTDGAFDFFAPLDVSAYKGQELELVGELSDAWLENVRQEDTLPDTTDAFRPIMHFTAPSGWLNDPNGLVYRDGIYHLYFQHNMFAARPSDLQWGHAVSRDLVHWEFRGTVLFPDETGMMFSGSGLCDECGIAGHGAGALLFFYTAAGGGTNWSKGHVSTQHMAYSTDGGATLQKHGQVVGPIADGTRDPKVTWHAQSGAYVMALYIENHDFGILRSEDLVHWELTQRLTFDKMWECPDLFELAVDGNPDDTRWIFWSADGYYVVGRFDGYTFTPESERLSAYTGIPYAAQTFWGTPGRKLSIAWLRTTNKGSNYSSMMSLPMELTLAQTDDGPRLRIFPARELESLRGTPVVMENPDSWLAHPIQNPDQPYELVLRFPPQERGHFRCAVPGGLLKVMFGEQRCELGSCIFEFDNTRPLELRLFGDRQIIEVFADGGRIYRACETTLAPASGCITTENDYGIVVEQGIYYPLNV